MRFATLFRFKDKRGRGMYAQNLSIFEMYRKYSINQSYSKSHLVNTKQRKVNFTFP